MDRGAGRTVVVIGDGDLSEETVRALEASRTAVSHLREPDGTSAFPTDASSGPSFDTLASPGA